MRFIIFVLVIALALVSAAAPAAVLPTPSSSSSASGRGKSSPSRARRRAAREAAERAATLRRLFETSDKYNAPDLEEVEAAEKRALDLSRPTPARNTRTGMSATPAEVRGWASAAALSDRVLQAAEAAIAATSGLPTGQAWDVFQAALLGHELAEYREQPAAERLVAAAKEARASLQADGGPRALKAAEAWYRLDCAVGAAQWDTCVKAADAELGFACHSADPHTCYGCGYCEAGSRLATGAPGHPWERFRLRAAVPHQVITVAGEVPAAGFVLRAEATPGTPVEGVSEVGHPVIGEPTYGAPDPLPGDWEKWVAEGTAGLVVSLVYLLARRKAGLPTRGFFTVGPRDRETNIVSALVKGWE